MRALELFLGEVLDPEKERARLEKMRGKLQADLDRGNKKLANENFVSKAPAKVVQEQRHKMLEIQAQLQSVTKNLAAL